MNDSEAFLRLSTDPLQYDEQQQQYVVDVQSRSHHSQVSSRHRSRSGDKSHSSSRHSSSPHRQAVQFCRKYFEVQAHWFSLVQRITNRFVKAILLCDAFLEWSEFYLVIFPALTDENVVKATSRKGVRILGEFGFHLWSPWLFTVIFEVSLLCLCFVVVQTWTWYTGWPKKVITSRTA